MSGTGTPQHRADLFVEHAVDPRERPAARSGERATLVGFLRSQRLTLELKCADLTPEQLARRAVAPSTLSLVGLVRHLADVERGWFRLRFAGCAGHSLFRTTDDPDGDFDGAVADLAVVEHAFATWRAEMAFTDQFVAEHELDFIGRDGQDEPLSLRALLVHMIEEYARHNGHADLLRELIDGRVGE